MVSSVRCLAAFCILVFFGGCAVPRPPLPHDSSNPLKRVAVLPFKNDTADVEGPDLMRKKMIQALGNRSYVVKDLKETDQILRDQMGITLGGQLDMTTAQKLGETLGVEGVLYGTLMDFDESTLGAINVRKVRGKFKLVNAMTGQSVWEQGLGVRSEMMMLGKGGAAATIASRVADARDQETPWVTIESTTTGSGKLGESFAIGLGTKLISKAIGKHLDHEAMELARRITQSLPWGPGPGAAVVPPATKLSMSTMMTPEPPSMGYMDWEGKRDFSAVASSVFIDKNRNEPFTMDMPTAVAGKKVRMDMDVSKMMKGDTRSPLNKMIVIGRGDEKMSYTLYPDTRRYMVHPEKEEGGEKPKVEKTKVGSELIDDHPTDKYKVKITYQDGRVEEGFIWNAKDLDGMTIKSEVEDKDYKRTTVLKNIVLETPQASLFELPAGYTEARNFREVMAADTKNK